MNPSLIARVALALGCGIAVTLAQTEVEKAVTVPPFDKIPERLTKMDDEWKQKPTEARKAVDAEEAAKRISESTAHSLRFSLRSSGAASLDNRNIISNARIPSENATLTTLAHDPRLRKLAEPWKHVQAGNSGILRNEEDLQTSAWDTLIGIPGNEPVVDLRERASRRALAGIMKSKDEYPTTEPLSTLIVNALEQAFSTGSKGMVRKVLRLDLPSGSLTSDEHFAYRTLAELLPDEAGAEPTPSNLATAERNRALLAQATSPGAARFAAEHLKKYKP